MWAICRRNSRRYRSLAVASCKLPRPRWQGKRIVSLARVILSVVLSVPAEFPGLLASRKIIPCTLPVTFVPVEEPRERRLIRACNASRRFAKTRERDKSIVAIFLRCSVHDDIADLRSDRSPIRLYLHACQVKNSYLFHVFPLSYPFAVIKFPSA